MKHGLFHSFLASLALVLALCSSSVAGEETHSPDKLPVKGMVTMVDLGSSKCIPCKMMEPILAELEQEYRGKAAIAFIDVKKHHDQAGRFGIKAIPTQVFYDAKGREMFRHVGFFDKASIKAVLAQLGVE